MKKLRLWWNFWFLVKNWDTVEKSMELIQNANSVWSSKKADQLTLEEMEGVFDLERVGRILIDSKKELRKDMKHLRKSLAK